jgi:hypothetical protein
LILLPQPPELWDYRCASPDPASFQIYILKLFMLLKMKYTQCQWLTSVILAT